MSTCKFRLLIPTLALIFLNAGCRQEAKFDKDKWCSMGDIGSFPYREQMVDDLVTHHQLKGLTYHQLLDSLGEPSNYGESDGTLRYLIMEDFESDIDPVHGKTLDLTLGLDSVVTAYKVTKW
ncbi:hypothetical protein [Hymenobacter metallilatus]|uniref:Uncharacterized protein n=1 Tax=Hymenobacter metallilatus TaxID=2493666 RepID=A0A3R9M477_9BACT|nr:hypothetical protein [Hymenobacter metallilatus]RSK36308.1 hypothetical protein EI290_05350 [Hymenobacter metallilatus]